MPADKTDDTILKEARERFDESEDGTRETRDAAYEDIRFGRLAEQWDKEVERTRRKEGRPCLTINKLPAFIRQVVNESRQNKPSILVRPVDNGADVETAEVLSGLIRSIERSSAADVAYDTAIDHSVSGGIGFFEIGIDYAHEESFDLECRISRIANPLMVHWDPDSTAFDASDWSYAFVSDWLSTEKFKERYPKADAVSWDGDSTREYVNQWTLDDKVRVAVYWLRTEKTRRIVKLSNGMVVRTDEYEAVKDALEADGITVVAEREVRYFEVTRRLINGVDVLEEDPWPGSTIPICPVWGEEVIVDGTRHFRSMIRDARDPQLMFNFWRSATTELVAMAPRAPFVGPQGFVPAGHEEKWLTANNRSWPYLEYAGNTAPRREAFAGIPAGALQEALNASDDMKAIIGIYDPSLGARSNETSGRAILARQRESDVSNYHFIDNLSRAIRYAGKVLVEVIPSVYNARQTVRILGEDMAEKVVRLAAQGGGDSAGPATAEQSERLYDLSVGKYDVEVKTGPSYSTQREETRETLIAIMREVPGAAALIGDIAAEHMDFQGADKVAGRLRMLLPPNIQAAEGIPVAAPVIPGAPTAPPGTPAGPPAFGAANPVQATP